MEKIEFKRAELEDKEIISRYLSLHASRSCERTFVNVFLWSRKYPVKWAIIENVLVFKSEDDTHVSFAFPIGEAGDIQKAMKVMEEYSTLRYGLDGVLEQIQTLAKEPEKVAELDKTAKKLRLQGGLK